MPGHKGQPFLGCEARDITEIPGADVLCRADGIIGESQRNAAELFHAGCTLYSTEGSTLCIKAMLMALLQGSAEKNGRKYLLAARNVHRAMVDACGLLDLDLRFITDPKSGHICSSVPEPEQLRRILERMDEMPIGVYITSPDYLGGMADIAGLSQICDACGIPLVVDNAHGAYLGFLDHSLHPIQSGAAMCCDSAHKTLPVLTGGAYLHISVRYRERYRESASRAMAVFGSTSPSYLVLQSLDLCNRYLAEDYRDQLRTTVHHVGQIKEELRQMDLPVLRTEPLKIVFHTAEAGYDGEAVAEEMRQYGIECEYADSWFVVWMYTPQNTEADDARIRHWGENTMLRRTRTPIPCPTLSFGAVRRACSIRQAMMQPGQAVPVEEAVGRVCAAECVACPPAIPIAVSGEKITAEMVELFQNYGIREVFVLAH